MPKKKKRTTVNAPFIRSQPEKIPDLEKYKFFEISRKIGGRFSQFLIFIGFLLCLASSTSLLAFTEIPVQTSLLINGMIFLGTLNVLCGLLLLVTE